jgi:hypothetical protein
MNNLIFRLQHIWGILKFVTSMIRVKVRFFIRKNLGL